MTVSGEKNIPEKPCLTFLRALTTLLIAAGGAQAGPLEDLQPGHWYEIPNSKIESVLPQPPNVPPRGTTGPKSIVIGYSGGAYDTKSDRYIVWGGGHGDYSGNEIYAFSMNTLSWQRIWGPSPNIPEIVGGDSNCPSTYSDGNPCSRHTYDGLEYLPSQDAFWIHGGSLWCGSGGAGRDIWTFNFSGQKSNQWAWKLDVPDSFGNAENSPVSDFDPVTGHIFLASQTWGLLEYDPVSNTVTRRQQDPIIIRMTGAMDPVRRKFVAMGNGLGYVYSIPNTGDAPRQSLGASGDDEIFGAYAPGFIYYPGYTGGERGADPLRDRMVAWSGGGDVYTGTWSGGSTLNWTRHPAQSAGVPSAAPEQGTYGRFRYIKSKNLFIVVNSISENVWVYRLSGPGFSPPTDQAPARPRRLRTR